MSTGLMRRVSRSWWNGDCIIGNVDEDGVLDVDADGKEETDSVTDGVGDLSSVTTPFSDDSR